MDPIKEIEEMRTALSELAKEHPELDDLVDDANEDLWALSLALEVEKEDVDDAEQ
jgi:hypothetical protein